MRPDQRRFGPRVRRVTAAIFLITRALAEGVRVFAISIVISIVLGTGERLSIALIVLLTLFYTFEGGMTAVIWTDVVQMCVYVAGALISFLLLVGTIPAGIVGLALQDPLRSLFATPKFAAAFLVVNGVIMFVGERFIQRQNAIHSEMQPQARAASVGGSRPVLVH